MRGSLAVDALRARVLWGAVAVAAAVLAPSSARADGVIRRRAQVVAQTPGHAARLRAPCGGDPHACAPELYRALTGISYGSMHAAAGDGGELGVDAFSTAFPFVVVTAGRIDAAYVPAHAAPRAAVTLVDLQAIYGCRDEAGALRPPVMGQIEHRCRPAAGLGAGGVVGEVDVDPRSGRVAVRWGEVHAQVELLGTSSTMAYTRHHVEAALGVSADSVWHGDDDPHHGSTHLPRGLLGLSGVQRTASGRWEASARLEWRPSPHDYGALAAASVLRRALIGPRTVTSVGVGVRASHWSEPGNAIDEVSAPARPTTLFAGVLLEVRHVSER